MRVDMHLHTSHSFDCLSRPDLVLDAALARGIDRICITDHNEISAALAMKRRFPDRIIVGEEVKTAERVDIIGLFITERIPKGTPARRTCEIIHDQGGIVYVPHPFAGGKGGGGRILDSIADLIDVIEGFNARLHDASLNEQAVAWAGRHDKLLGAGSDAHTLAEVARGFVEVPEFDNEPGAFLAALRQSKLHGTMSPRSVHLASTWAKVRKRFGHRNEE